jgi:CRISP-associated protein Cas1
VRVLKTLYVAGHRSRITLQQDALIVRDPDTGDRRVPLTALDAVVLLGNGQVTTQVMAACVARGVRIASVSRGGKLRFTVGGPVSGNVHLRLAQVRASDDTVHAAAIARNCVAGKLQNSRRLLQRWAWDAREPALWTIRESADHLEERIRDLGTTANLDRIRGLEGDSARRYFQGMRAALWKSGLIFDTRTRRPPRDAVNALLSYTYGLLLVELVGALESVGLDPQIGFLHGARSGRPALALDLIEELRAPVADRFVVTAVRRGQFGDSDFTFTPGGACYLSDRGRRRFMGFYEQRRDREVAHPFLGRTMPVAMIPQVQATLLARHLRGDLPAYAPFLMPR